MWTAVDGTAKIKNMTSFQEKLDSRPSYSVSRVSSLVNSAANGNRFAFEQLIDIYQNDIFKMVFYRTRSHMDAEDLTQDIFLQAFKNLSKLKSVEKFKSWLYSIAVNRVRDFYRKKRFRDLFTSNPKTDADMQNEDENTDHPDIVDDITKKDFWKCVGTILKKLSAMEKEVFTLRFVDSLNINEISSILGKSESTIKTHLYRALGKFKKESSLLQQFKEVIQ